jgi:MFS family permease
VKQRGLYASILYVAIPGLTGIAAPAIGGAVIQFFSFNSVFVLGIAIFAIALIFSLKIKFKPATGGLVIPKSYLLLVFAAIVIICGITEVYWIAYPLFLHSISGNFLNMGIITAVLSVVFTVIALIVGKVSEVEKHRLNFGVFSLLIGSAWLFSMAFVRTVPQLIGVSIFSGLCGAFWPAVFSLYGDFFKRKYHASLVVLWEVMLMIGRLGSLVPVVVFINTFDYSNYFLVCGIISLALIVPGAILQFLHSKGF